jgi:hypothetical protein
VSQNLKASGLGKLLEVCEAGIGGIGRVHFGSEVKVDGPGLGVGLIYQNSGFSLHFAPHCRKSSAILC